MSCLCPVLLCESVAITSLTYEPAGVFDATDTTPPDIEMLFAVEESEKVYGPVPPVAEYVPVEAELPNVVVSVESPVTTIAVGIPVTAVDESELPADETALNLT